MNEHTIGKMLKHIIKNHPYKMASFFAALPIIAGMTMKYGIADGLISAGAAIIIVVVFTCVDNL